VAPPIAQRTAVAVCEPSRPSHAIATPASRTAASNSCQAAISRAISSGVAFTNAVSPPNNVNSTFISRLH
jgi:hypothetical protein